MLIGMADESELEVGKGILPVDSELELGLGLSLGGRAVGKNGGAWRERGRILTAKDFPSVGSKRAADSASHQRVSSPPRSSNQVVGWPPIGSHRMNSIIAKSSSSEENNLKKVDELKDVSMKVTKKVQVGFVKVNMDGVCIGRKIDIRVHSSYESLAGILDEMFIFANSITGMSGNSREKVKPLRLLDGSSEFVLTYEDKEGDWMLVGDVPWRMFIRSVKRLRIMKTSEANGLASRERTKQV